MAGRGRGTASLMSVVLEQQSGSSPPSFQKAVDESSSKKVKERDTMHTSQEDSRNAVRPSPREEASSPLGVFGIRTQPNNPLPSGGRGLMPPGHFQKTSPPKDSPQGQPEKKLLSSPTSGILPNVKDKTPELQSAMAYLNKFAKGEPQVKIPAQSNQKKVQGNPRVNQMQPKPMPMKSSLGQNQQKLTPVLTPKEKAEADAEWQKYKFQRQINGIIANSTMEDAAEVFSDLKIKLDECSLSQKYSQYDELGIMLESLIDKATGSSDFVDLSKTFIKLIADYDGIKFESTFPPLVSRKIEEIVRVSASDRALTTCAEKFCQLLGELYKISSETDTRFHGVILSCLEDCLERWTYPDGVGSGVAGFHVIKAETHANAATEVFKVMALQDTEKDRVEQVMKNVGRMVMLVKESVLNECLPRKIREIYLDLLLAYTPRGQHGSFMLSALPDIEQVGVSDSDVTQNDDMPWRKKNISESTTSSFASKANEETDQQQLEDYKEPRFGGAASDTYDDDASSTQVDNVEETVIIESEEVDAVTAVDEKEAESEKETESEKEIMEDEASQEDAENDVEMEAWEYEPVKPKSMNGSVVPESELGPYDKIKTMMKDLKLEDQIFRFEDNVIRDTVLGADRKELKNILKEASFPAGVIYEICLYLDKNFEEGGKNGRNDQNRWSSSERDAQFSAPNFRFKDTRNSKFGNKPRQGDFGSESGPRKKLLGIGRGGSSFESSRNKSRGRFNDGSSKGQQSQKNWGRNRSGSFEDSDRNSNNWRGRDERTRNPGRFSPSFENRRFQGDQLSSQDAHPRYHRQSSGGDASSEIKQIGKVTPLQNPREMAAPKERRSPNAEQKPGSVFGFGGQPSMCYRCGSKEHLSYECTDMKSVFIG